MSRAEFGSLRGGSLLRKSVSSTDGCGYALRPLPEAAAMLILARKTAGGELERSRILGLSLANFWTARMARGHDVMVCSRMLGDFMRRMHVPVTHGQHRGQGHLRPGHHDHKQGRRNGLLHHAVLVWQTKDSHDVTTITSVTPANI